jgi:hypothetical protein
MMVAGGTAHIPVLLDCRKPFPPYRLVQQQAPCETAKALSYGATPPRSTPFEFRRLGSHTSLKGVDDIAA